MSRIDPKLKKWGMWVKAIEQEVQSLVIARDIFWSLQALIKNNPAVQRPNIFYWYMGSTYTAYSIVGIRRQVKSGDKSISLRRLLAEIAEEPEKVSRKHYRSLYGSSENAYYADCHFDDFCAAKGDPHISAAMVRADLSRLEGATKKCENLADKRIAHSDRKKVEPPTFGETDQAIDTLHELCLKYGRLLLEQSLVTLLPTYQYDWQDIFEHPWRRS